MAVEPRTNRFDISLALGVSVMEKGRIAREIAPDHVMDEAIVRGTLAV